MIRGYTLIELLVVAGIVILLSGVGVVAFSSYRERRVVQIDAVAVAERLRSVQTKATAIEVPTVCTSVTNYVVTYSGSGLTVAATCPGVGSVAIGNLSLTMANSTFSQAGSVTFNSRSVSASPATLCVTRSGVTYKIEVNEAANVSRPVYSATCP